LVFANISGNFSSISFNLPEMCSSFGLSADKSFVGGMGPEDSGLR